MLLTLFSSRVGLNPGQNFHSMKSVRKLPLTLLRSGRVTLDNCHYAVFPIISVKQVKNGFNSDLEMYSLQAQDAVE